MSGSGTNRCGLQPLGTTWSSIGQLQPLEQHQQHQHKQHHHHQQRQQQYQQKQPQSISNLAVAYSQQALIPNAVEKTALILLNKGTTMGKVSYRH
jgi:hypothetical protein